MENEWKINLCVVNICIKGPGEEVLSTDMNRNLYLHFDIYVLNYNSQLTELSWEWELKYREDALSLIAHQME